MKVFCVLRRGDRPSLRFSSLPVAPMKRVRNGSGGGFPFSSGGIPSQTSAYGISETAWLLNHLNLRIFRLGRLQFAPDSVSVGQTVEFSAAGGPSLSLGERFYWVHIPEGESLTREFCDDSFALAAEFFGGRMVFACDSWILSPALRTLFRQDSNLAAFARRFKIVSFCADSRSAERYLFGKIGDPACYSEDTSLQRAAKKYLLEKGALGTGLGIFEYI